jgi:hypothetical protein
MRRTLSHTLQLAALLSAGLLALASVVPEGDGDDDGDDGGGVKTAIIDSAEGGCFFFASGSTTCVDGPADVMVEPWCTELPGLCGDYLVTSSTSLDDPATPPESGYCVDELGYENCEQMPLNTVIVFRLSDGTYGKGRVTGDVYTEDDTSCNHRVTFEYVYPF